MPLGIHYSLLAERVTSCPKGSEELAACGAPQCNGVVEYRHGRLVRQFVNEETECGASNCNYGCWHSDFELAWWMQHIVQAFEKAATFLNFRIVPQ
jgi:hypothetical protein